MLFFFIRSLFLFFCYAVLCVLSSFVIISVGKRELVDLHLLSSGCLLADNILWPLLAVHHAGIQDFFRVGGGGGSRPGGQKTVWTTFFFVLNLFYSLQRGPNGFVKRKLYFSNDQERVQQFPGGPTFSRGGGGILISIETISLVIFQGVQTPFPSLWIEK